MILCGSIAMLQAPMFDGLSFDPFSFQQDGLSPTEVSVGGCDVVQALVVSPVIVILDEGLDLGLKVALQIVVLQQDAVLQGLMPAFDLALGLRMIRGAAIWARTSSGMRFQTRPGRELRSSSASGPPV